MKSEGSFSPVEDKPKCFKMLPDGKSEDVIKIYSCIKDKSGYEIQLYV